MYKNDYLSAGIQFYYQILRYFEWYCKRPEFKFKYNFGEKVPKNVHENKILKSNY